jgi:hypothetical protein
VSRRFGIWTGCVVLALCSAPALAAPESGDETPASAAEQATSTLVFVRADAASANAASFDGIEAQLRELSVNVVSVPALAKQSLASQALRAGELSRSHDALGTIWFGEDDAAKLRVYVYDAKHRQLTSRTLSRPDVAMREEVAVVLRSAISALLAGQRAALEPVTLAEPTAAPAAPPPAVEPQRLQRLLAGVGYAATTYSSGAFQHGVQLLLAARPTRDALLGLDATWFQDSTLAGGGAQAVLERYPVELFAGYAFAHSPRFFAYFETALQLELVRRTTRVSDPRLVALPAENRLRFAVAPRLRTVLEPSPSLLGFAAFGADITTDRYDYVVQSGSGPVRLATRTVRPRLEAGVAVRFW